MVRPLAENGTGAFGVKAVVKPVSCTLPSTHSTCVNEFGLNEASESVEMFTGGSRGVVNVVVLGDPDTRLVKALTSAQANVLLKPSVKSAGLCPLLGRNAPSP